jgi:ABC-type sugar transport system permease subunit
MEALFRDDIFHQAVGNTIAVTAVAVVLQTGVGLLLAILISELRRGRLPYRMMFFTPVVLSAVAVGSIWKWMYAPYFGLFTNIAATIGLGDVYSSLLSSQATALWAIMGASVWRWAGFNTVIYLA